jgi:hypothetical protein
LEGSPAEVSPLSSLALLFRTDNLDGRYVYQ